MVKKKLAVAVLGALMFSPAILPPNNFLPAPVVFAEMRTIEADGYYIMGDDLEENQGVAKERAREDAKRAASEKVGVFIESISEVKNSELTRDEIRTISANILKVISAPVMPEVSGESIKFHCHITVTVDTSNVTDQLLQDRQKLDELLRQNKEQAAEIDRLNAEIKNLRDKFKNASESERAEINAKVRRNEEQFTAAQWNNKGLEFYNSGEYNKAIECLNKAIELNPALDMAFCNLGATYNLLGNYEKAAEYLNEAVKLNSQNDFAWNNLGLLYKQQGKYNQAVEYYNTALELNPKNSVAWYNLALTYNSLGNYHQAVDCYEEAVKLNPNDSVIWNNFGFAYRKLNQYDKAIECYKKSVELNPKYDNAWSNLGAAYFYSENYQKALECFNKALELNPDKPNYQKWRENTLAKMN